MTAQRESQVTLEQLKENIERLKSFMTERQLILQKRRNKLPAPWTNDPILRDNRFCNIFREDDRVTIWVRKNIREPYADHNYLWFMLAIARYINWPPTLEKLMNSLDAWPADKDFDPAVVTYVLERLAKGGSKVYTGAYMIRAESDPKKPWYKWSKHRYIAEIVLGRLWEDRKHITRYIEASSLLESAWSILQADRYVGWGPFMAYEWVTDLRHTRYLNNALDIYSWANAGPGAIRGLNRLHGRYLETQPDKRQTCLEMNELMMALNEDKDDFQFSDVFGPHVYAREAKGPRFEMRDIEHTLCEFDKYERCRLGQGKMRSVYHWLNAGPLP